MSLRLACAAALSLTATPAISAEASHASAIDILIAGEATGRAGLYSGTSDGRTTASGERFDMYRLTAASDDLPMGAYVEVTNLASGQHVVLRINDRRAGADQLLTLSRAAANRLGVPQDGSGAVRVRYLGMMAPARVE